MPTSFDQQPIPFGSANELRALLPRIEGTKRRQTKLTTSFIVVLTVLALIAFGSTRTTRPHGIVSTSSAAASKSEPATATTTIVPEEPRNPITPPTIQADPEVIAKTEATEEGALGGAVGVFEKSTAVQDTENSETDSTEETDRRFTTYGINWGAFHPCIFPYCINSASALTGCVLGTGPSIQISCGQGGNLDFIPQSNCRLLEANEDETRHTTLHCEGTRNLFDQVQVTCHGTGNTALQVQVQVDQHTYRCNAILNEHRSFDGRDASERGGAAGQRVSVSALQNDKTWSEVLSQSRAGHCSTYRQCSDPYVSCQNGPGGCAAYVPFIVGAVAREDAAMAAFKPDKIAGMSCSSDHQCQSGDCSDSTCH